MDAVISEDWDLVIEIFAPHLPYRDDPNVPKDPGYYKFLSDCFMSVMDYAVDEPNEALLAKLVDWIEAQPKGPIHGAQRIHRTMASLSRGLTPREADFANTRAAMIGDEDGVKRLWRAGEIPSYEAQQRIAAALEDTPFAAWLMREAIPMWSAHRLREELARHVPAPTRPPSEHGL